jgi:hypothetical protein
MKNKQFIFFIIIAILLTAFLLYFFSGKLPMRYIWVPNLEHNNRQPYDYALLQDLLKENYSWEKIEEKVLNERVKQESVDKKGYFFIGHYPYHDEKTAEALYDFIERGGEAVIICHNSPDALLELIFKEEEYGSENFWLNTHESKKISATFKDRPESYTFAFKSGVKDTSEYQWGYFPSFALKHFRVLGSLADEEYSETKFPNFVYKKIGKGYLYWHSNPLLFTNLYLSKNSISGFNHLNAFLSHFRAEHWIWDYASTIPPPKIKNKPKQRFDKPKTPMEYIFSQPALTWAWLLLLAIAAFYVLFGAKRRQQSIAIVEINRNTSLEFINTIGRLYFQQQNHKVIFEKIMQLFRAHLRRKYGILLKEDDIIDEEKLNFMVKRTDINKEIINDIFENYLSLKSKLKKEGVEMSSDTLNKFYLTVDKFYKAEQSRKITATNS